MSYKAIVLIVALAAGSVGAANGQFLKKLGEKAEKAAERTVERRVERETEKKTDKALDKVFEGGDGKGKKEKGGTKENTAVEGSARTEANDETVAMSQSALAAMLGGGSLDDVRDTYTFSYRATMKIIDENEKEEANLLYWLEPDAAYFGTGMPVGDATNQIAVMDMDIKGMVMFMDDGKQKTAMRLSGTQQLMDKFLTKAAEQDAEDVTIKPLESKTILGYRCKGFQMETDEGISKIWITDEAPVGMVNSMLKAENIPGGLSDLGANALFMEMEYVAKKGNNGNVRMVCTELKPVSMTIQKKEYQGIGMPSGR